MKIEEKGKFTVIHFEEKKIGVSNIAEVKKEAINAIENAGNSVVLDFSDVDYLDSSGLGMLLSIQKKASAKDLRLCCVNESILNLLRLTKLDTVFKVFNDLGQATR